MHPSKLPFNLQRLANLDPRFLDPKTSLVVMPEETEQGLDDARLALEGLSCMLESMEGMNIKLRKAGENCKYVEMPPDCLSALLRMVNDKITIACKNPSLTFMRDVRPDLFKTTTRGV